MKPIALKLFEIAQYTPDVHGAFVRSTWAKGALCDGSRAARAKLDALLAVPGARGVLGHLRGCPGDFCGWAAATPTALIFAFVLPVHRGKGLAGMLVESLGVSSPVPLMHWTPNARRLAAAGKPVYYAPFKDCTCAPCVAAHPKLYNGVPRAA